MPQKSYRKKSAKYFRSLLNTSVLAISMGSSQPAHAADPFLAEIIMFGGNFAPRGWALCDGQLLPINTNQALFSLLGTTYGGDGRTTFALPDLRGRVAIHPGSGPGLSTYRLGQKGGIENVTLDTSQLPSHNHAAIANVRGINRAGNSASPGGNTLASKARTNIYQTAAPDVDMQAGTVTVTVANAGGGQAHENRMPFLAINHILALQGIFPSP